MALISAAFEFRSDQFAIDPREDEETNPGCYGRELGEWLRANLAPDGEPLIAEDWGWCVMLQREPFSLWVGCANVTDVRSGPPPTQPVAWSCIVGADVLLWTSYFWRRLARRVSPEGALRDATDRLEALLRSNPRIRDLSREER